MGNIRDSLGKNISRMRQDLGWTQAKLAEKVDISPTFLMHVEHGTRGASLETVELLAAALGVDVSYLFNDLASLPNYSSQHGFKINLLERDLTEKVSAVIRDSILGLKNK